MDQKLNIHTHAIFSPARTNAIRTANYKQKY